MDIKVNIEVFNTFFKLSVKNNLAEINVVMRSIFDYLTDITVNYLPKGGKEVIVNGKIYHFEKNGCFFILPISMLKSTIHTLNNYYYTLTKKNIIGKHNVKYFTNNVGGDVQFNMNPKYTLRDYQELYLDSIINPKSPPYVLVDLRPGAGKTFISVNALHRMGKKTAIVILPKYMDKWIEDIEDYTDIPSDRVYRVEGRSSINHIMENDVDYDVFLISIRTMMMYINQYEGAGDVASPTEVFNKMKIGVLLSDESHQENTSLNRIVMYSNASKVIGLSATYTGNSTSDTRIQNVLFPPEVRISNLSKFDKYIDIKEVGYRFTPKQKLKYQTRYGYSHGEYEKTFLKNKPLRIAYFNMLVSYICFEYIKRREEGDKCLVFFYLKDMCTLFQSYLKEVLEVDLKILRFIGEDPYSNIEEGDIIVTTPGSCGTALTVPNLIFALNTVMISSVKANIQITGRLRKLNNKQTVYMYVLNRDISTHRNMANKRDRAIRHMAKTYYKTDHPNMVSVDYY